MRIVCVNYKGKSRTELLPPTDLNNLNTVKAY